MKKKIESVINISEGKNLTHLKILEESLGSIKRLDLRHWCYDRDHHRSVWTLFGDFTSIKEAVNTIYRWALKYIDMNTHQGVHPRIGAVDVVPFIPVQGVSKKECLDFSHQLAKDIAQTYQVPIYMYGQSAQTPSRQSLVSIRRQGFEGLTQKMQSLQGQSDYGPPQPHPKLGATAMGVRELMVAFNVMIQSQDLSIALDIAKKIRGSSGGIQGIQALGLSLTHMACVQVSMNIYPQTCPWDLFQIVEFIGQEASQHRVGILNTEIIGMLPQSILTQVALDYLKPYKWQQSQIIQEEFNT